MTMFLPSHMAEIRAKLRRTVEIGTDIVLYGGFIAFMGLAVTVVIPFVICDVLIEKVHKLID